MNYKLTLNVDSYKLVSKLAEFLFTFIATKITLVFEEIPIAV